MTGDPTPRALRNAIVAMCREYQRSSGMNTRVVPDCEGGLSIEIGHPDYLTAYRFNERGFGKKITFKKGCLPLVEELP